MKEDSFTRWSIILVSLWKIYPAAKNPRDFLNLFRENPGEEINDMVETFPRSYHACFRNIIFSYYFSYIE